LHAATVRYLIACLGLPTEAEREAIAKRLDFTEAPIAFIRDPHKFDSLVRISHERYWRFCEVQTLCKRLSLSLPRAPVFDASNQVSNDHMASLYAYTHKVLSIDPEGS